LDDDGGCDVDLAQADFIGLLHHRLILLAYELNDIF
jgi:hypothetical protein